MTCLSAFCFVKKKSTNAPTRTQHVIAGKRGRIWRSKTNHFFLSQSNTERKADKLLVPLLFSITHSVTQKKSAEKKTQKKNRKKLTRTKQVSKEKIPQQQGMNSSNLLLFHPAAPQNPHDARMLFFWLFPLIRATDYPDKDGAHVVSTQDRLLAGHHYARCKTHTSTPPDRFETSRGGD